MKKKISRLSPMLLGMFLLVNLLPTLHAEEPAKVKDQNSEALDCRIDIVPGKVDVYVGDDLFTSYRHTDDWKYPYFWPVNGPGSGQSVTTETSEPYPHHHSLFFACDRVNGANYWQEGLERGQIFSQGPRVLKAEGRQVVFIDECLWKEPNKEPSMADRRIITIEAPDADTLVIDFEIAWSALEDVTILQTNHSLFSARMVPELSVNGGGTIVNATGDSGEKATFGKNSPWADYYGTRDGVTEGLAILQHPGNRWFPAPWFTRDYGFFSPTPMMWLEGERLDLKKGEVIELKYRVVVHEGDVQSAEIDSHYEKWAQTAAE